MKKAGYSVNPFDELSREGKKIFSNKWNVAIIQELGEGIKRFGELQEVVGTSAPTLNKHLKFLQYEGLINRKAKRTIPPTVEYSLTELGENFLALFQSLKKWSLDYIIYTNKRKHVAQKKSGYRGNPQNLKPKEKKAMNEKDLRQLLRDYKEGTVSESDALTQLKNLSVNSVENIGGFAAVDHARELRQGFPEVVYAAGKTNEQLSAIFKALYERSDGNLIATRASREQFSFLTQSVPAAVYDETARMIYVDRKVIERRADKKIMVVTAGTSDVPVAEEARLTAHLLGNSVATAYDCGVAGIHRLFAHINEIQRANVLIVVAGMEGALASVVGGLTDKPVIAVPTSIGYGASFKGLAALLAMLNSCAAGVSVVNIDNGFGAGVLASKINRLSCS